MTGLVVSDASCLIDLHKVELLFLALELPYRFVLPLPIRESEMTSFTERDWLRLDSGGLEMLDISPEQAEAAERFVQGSSGLSANDGLCLLLAQDRSDSVLLTGDKLLRRAAEAAGVRVHGVLWVVDQLQEAGACSASRLIAALDAWHADLTVFLPPAEIDRRLRWLRRSAGL